jgi:hypothetical protein
MWLNNLRTLLFSSRKNDSCHRRPFRPRRRARIRPQVEPLEARNLLSLPANVLVNNPAEDNGNFFGQTGLDTQSETAIVLGAKSNVIVAYNDDGQFTYPTPLNPTFTGYSLSTNGGGSFTDQGSLPGNTPYWPRGDPVLARSSETGTIFLANMTYNLDQLATTGGNGERIGIFRSADNGASFSSSMVNGSPGFVAGVDVADKPWIAVDNYPGPGYGNVYLAWTDFTVKNDGSQVDKGIYLTRSTDDGVTWGPSGGVPIDVKAGLNHPQGTFVTVAPDHTVYVFWWVGNTSESIEMSKSTDQGQTFTNPVIVTRLQTNGSPNGDLGLTNSTGQSFRTAVFPQAAVNPVTGDIYVVYNDEPKDNSKDKADIFLTESTDGGATWSAPRRVNDDNTTNDQWQPAIAVTPDGTHVGISWYDRRLDPANNLIDRFGVIGTVSGHSVSFAPNFRITDVSFPPAFGQDPFVLPNYMGDYDMAAADNNYFYTTWGDNRSSDGFFANQPDVRFAKIPIEGIQDSALAVGLAASVSSGSAIRPGLSLVVPGGMTALDAVFANLKTPDVQWNWVLTQQFSGTPTDSSEGAPGTHFQPVAWKDSGFVQTVLDDTIVGNQAIGGFVQPGGAAGLGIGGGIDNLESLMLLEQPT